MNTSVKISSQNTAAAATNIESKKSFRSGKYNSLVLASKKQVRNGSLMWHVYLKADNVENNDGQLTECYFNEPLKALRFAFLLRKRHHGFIPQGVYNKLYAEVKAATSEAEAAQIVSEAPAEAPASTEEKPKKATKKAGRKNAKKDNK